MTNPHKGDRFEDFLKEEGIFDECTAGAIKKIIVMELEEAHS